MSTQSAKATTPNEELIIINTDTSDTPTSETSIDNYINQLKSIQLNTNPTLADILKEN